jgi:hypothetical protein
MRLNRILVPAILLATGAVAYAGDTLEEYTEKCEQATGVKILKEFDCDAGTEVPDTHATSTPPKWGPGTEKCDRPNHLNKECDPGSRFQILPTSTDQAFAVAHCRKRGHTTGDGKYKDIAIIQHNKTNGATCFYQALGENLDGKKVQPPSKGVAAWSWKTPAETAAIKCGGCHDNGPIIRSPYLSQVTGTDGKRLLPGALEPYTFNSSGDPYSFVGSDFSSWKAFTVEVKGNECTLCHRMGVNNVFDGMGTARDFGIRATAKDQGLSDKNLLSTDSPMWMVPNDGNHTAPPNGPLMDQYSQAHADSAKAIKTCADQFIKDGPPRQTPSTDCTITQFTGSKMAAVRWQGDTAYFFKVGQYVQYDTKGNTDVVPTYPASLKGKGLWASGIDAAVLWGTGKAYLFKGKNYFRYDLKKDSLDAGYPKPISPSWPGVWEDGVDAAVPWSNGKIYFFKGDQYIRYDVAADKADSGYPKPIKGNWPGLWADGIDTGIQWNDKKAYFFKGNQYVRYDVTSEKVDPGYPKLIKGNWKGLDW